MVNGFAASVVQYSRRERSMSGAPPATHRKRPRRCRRRRFRVFLKLETIAFGGPAARIAIMDDEFVFISSRIP